MDICIADNGITLLGSYCKMEGNKITYHLSAMKAANFGISTKNLTGSRKQRLWDQNFEENACRWFIRKLCDAFG